MVHVHDLLYFLLPAAYAATAIVTVGLAAYVVRTHWEKPAARLLAVVAVCLAVWSVGMGCRLMSTTMGGTITWNAVAYVGIAGTAVSWFLFSLRYTGRDRFVTHSVVGLLLVPAVLLVALVATSGYHSLYYSDMRLAARWGHTVLYTDETWLFYAAAGWHYLLFLVGAALIVQFALYSHRLYRMYAAVLSVGAIAPLLLNLLYVFDILGTGFDPTPFAFGGSILLVAAAVFNADFIDVMPIARARVLEVIDEAVVVLDREGRILDYNRRAASVLSIEPGDSVVGRPAAAHLPDPVTSAGVLSATDEENTPHEVELPGGEWFLLRRRPVDAHGEQVATILAMVDITERKAYERQLEARNQRLERFASVVSHDLRNPLNVASGRLHLLREDCDSEHLDPLDESLSRMDRIIDDMLWLAREGRDVGDLSATVLPTIVGLAWANVDTGEATLAMDLEEYLTVLADDDRLKQLFENLFRNAVQHGGESVSVRVGMLADGLGVYVEDDGPGIPEAIRQRVFERGYSTAELGTGIGLRTVTEVVTGHGWEVSATDAIGGGARIEISGITFVSE